MFENVFKKFSLKYINYLFLFCFLLCFLFLFGCKRDSSDRLGDGSLNVVVTNYPIYDFVREISKNCDSDHFIKLNMLIPPGIDPHAFEPTPADVKLVENCDLLIYVGGPEDLWLEKILNSIDNENKSKIKTLNLLTCLGFDDRSKEVDYHVWTGLSNSLKIAELVKNNLIELDSKNIKIYEQNYLNFSNSICSLQNDFHDVVSKGKRKVLVVADKFPFKYFSDEFGLEVETPFLNCSSKAEASINEVGRIVKFVNDNEIPVILKIDGENGEIARTVSNETGAKVATFYVCHTISKESFNKKISYLNMLRKNLEILKEALN